MPVRDARTLGITAVLAVSVPVGAAAWVGARTDQLAQRLGRAAEVPARIGQVDATLTGTIRLSDVALGDIISADAIEGSVGMSSLLDGELRADEIRVEAPRVAIRVDPDGDSDLARLARRLASRRASPAATGGGRRVRRIVVDRGQLTARIAGLGELAAEQVELVPDARGARLVTGPVRVVGGTGPLRLDVVFARSAAELELPAARVGRARAGGGAGHGTRGDAAHRLAQREVAAGHRAASALELRAVVDDAGVARAVGADVTPRSIVLFGERVPLRALAGLAPPGLDLSSARASGSLAVRRAAQLELKVDGTIDQLVVDHPVVAPAPIALSPELRGEVALGEDAVALSRGELRLGAIEVAARGWVRRGAPVSGELEVELARAACRDLLAALPERLRGPLDGMALGGDVAARGRLAIDLAAPTGDGVRLSGGLAGGCTVSAEPPAADVTRLAEPSVQRLADGTRARIGKGEPSWTPLRELPSHVRDAFVSAEDARFYDHAGFDLRQIARSLEIDLRERRLARGGSTISQQLVKNAFLTRRRSFDRKLQEAILTWRLEAHLTKKQILERYLNIIELGPRVFGITEAARYWFDVSPRDLTVRQAAFLAALTSQPTSMSRRVREAGGLDPDSAERVRVVLRAMRRDRAIDRDEYAEARKAKLRFASTAVPER